MKSRQKISLKEYNAVHYWIRTKFEKGPCESVECSGLSKRIEWALIQGKKYEKKRENFICLCRSCHAKYDIDDNTKEKLSKAFKGKKLTETQKASHYRPVVQVSENGDPIAYYSSTREAAEKTGTSMPSINSFLKGRYKFTTDRNKGGKNYWKSAKDYSSNEIEQLRKLYG